MSSIIFFTFYFFATTNILAQTDTTLKEFWPLGLGDTWQFRNQYGEISTYIQVVDEDTLLANGYQYAKIGVPPNFNTGFSFDRIDSLLRIQWYVPWGSDSCGGTAPEEISIYRLGEPVGSIWLDCMNWNGFLAQSLIRYDSIHFYPIFGQLRETMVFQFGFYDTTSGDTLFVAHDLIVRGIGLYRREYWEAGGYEVLTGAIINGQQYGTIVSANETAEILPEKIILHQNYPNPFNPLTTIRFEISKTTNVNLKILNILGEEVAVLVNEIKYPGSYEVEFSAGSFGNAKHLSSGVYIAVLQTNEAQLTKAMLLIK